MNNKITVMRHRGLKYRKVKDNTPCVRNCCLDDRKICVGCGRSLPEILEWHKTDSHRQQEIVFSARRRLSSKGIPQ